MKCLECGTEMEIRPFGKDNPGLNLIECPKCNLGYTSDDLVLMLLETVETLEGKVNGEKNKNRVERKSNSQNSRS